MQTDLVSEEDFRTFIQNNKTAAVYFSSNGCNVCKVLKPKIMEFLRQEFPSFLFAYVNCDENKSAAAQNSVFTVPAFLVFVDGNEVLRKSRNISLAELHHDLDRISIFLS